MSLSLLALVCMCASSAVSCKRGAGIAAGALFCALQVAAPLRSRIYGGNVVRAEALVSLYGRPAAPRIDPSVDLGRTRDGLGKASWIMPEPAGPPYT